MDKIYYLFILISIILLLYFIKSSKRRVATVFKLYYSKFMNYIIGLIRKCVGNKKINILEKKITEKFFLSRVKSKNPLHMYITLKILIPIITFVTVFMISNTNLNIYRNSILKDYNFGSTQLEKKSLMGLTEKQFLSLQENEKKIAEFVLNEIDHSEFNQLEEEGKINYIIAILRGSYQFSDADYYSYAKRILAKYDMLNSIKLDRAGWAKIVLASFLSIWLIDAILYGLSKWKKPELEDEIEQLELTTVLVGGTRNISVYDILLSLESTSKIFNPYLKTAKNEYAINNEKSLEGLRKVPYKDFLIIAKTLQQAQNSSLDKAIENLKKHLERKKKKREIEQDNILSKKDMLMILFMAISVGTLLLMWFYPLATIFKSFN
ncbi:hypothetical protein ACF3M2_14025 [Tissierella carlieri]|uniref:hypothetical protein n=1 Tax=Tissierella carlieri TaxID=689904 RepID=UPI003866BE5E